MHGSFRFRLLAVAFLILTPPTLVGGQTTSHSLASSLGKNLALTGSSLPPPSNALPGISPPLTHSPAPEQLPPGTIGLYQISHAAGTIFSGRVTAIARVPPSAGHAIETISITFQVENAIRGASPGENLTIFQWIGLWTSGQRYRVGEHVLLFLYPPSKLGLTSCVAGSMGRFTIDPVGRVLLTNQHVAAFRTDPVLAGKSRVSMRDFSQAVIRAWEQP